MQSNERKQNTSTFPLRLMPSVRKGAEEVSKREGVSLNQFINLALSEKLALLEHNEWVARRPKASPEKIKRALDILSRPTGNAPEDGEDLS